MLIYIGSVLAIHIFQRRFCINCKICAEVTFPLYTYSRRLLLIDSQTNMRCTIVEYIPCQILETLLPSLKFAEKTKIWKFKIASHNYMEYAHRDTSQP